MPSSRILNNTHIPSGSTVAVNGGTLYAKKLTGDMGEDRCEIQNVTFSSGVRIAENTVDLGGTYIVDGGSASGVTITGGSNASSGGAFMLYREDFSLTNCIVSGNVASRGGAFAFASGTINLINTVVSGNVASAGKGGNDVQIKSYANLNINGGCNVNDVGIQTDLAYSSYIRFAGSNVVGNIYPVNTNYGCSVIVSSGAILDLTGNTNATPIAPGGGITFESGGATVITNSGGQGEYKTYMMDNVKLPAGAKLTNTEVVDISATNGFSISGSVSGATFVGQRVNFINGAAMIDVTAANLGSTYIYSGTTASGFVANSGGRANVLSGAVLNEPVINSGGGLIVASGGTALLVTSNTGAVVTVVEGGYITYKAN